MNPRNLLATAVLVTTVGNGMYLAGGALYLVRWAGMDAAHVGLGLSAAGAVGLAAGVPIGRLADRYGPREVYLATVTAEGLAVGALALVRSFPAFLVVAMLVGLAEQGSRAARGALVAQVGGASRTQFRARLRAVTNIGISVGTAVAGAAIHIGSLRAYLVLILGDAVSFLLTAVVVALLPATARPSRPAAVPGTAPDRPRTALRDGGFLAVSLLYGIPALQYPVLTVALPLWIVGHTHAPAWTVAPLLMTNTALVVLAQVRLSRDVRDIGSAARATRQAGWFLLLGCALFAASHGLPAAATVAVLAAAVVSNTLAEMRFAAAGFEVSFGLAPDDAQGEYQGVFALGTGVFLALGPAVVVASCVEGGPVGWLGLGAALALSCLAAGAVARRVGGRRAGTGATGTPVAAADPGHGVAEEVLTGAP